MSKFSDKLGIKKPKEEVPDKKWVQVNINFDCPECGGFVNNMWYDKASKKLKTVCESEHEEISDVDLSWLMR